MPAQHRQRGGDLRHAGHFSVYAATKAGVRSLTETLDGEWAGDGIAVRSLCPGFIDTPLLDHNPNAQSNEQIRGRVQRAGLEISPVSDVAEAAWRRCMATGSTRWWAKPPAAWISRAAGPRAACARKRGEVQANGRLKRINRLGEMHIAH